MSLSSKRSLRSEQSTTKQELIARDDASEKIPELSIIVPTYNERENVVRTLRAICRALVGVEFTIVVVDDGSEDRTADLCERLRQEIPQLRVIRRRRRGLASAIFDGMANSAADYVAVIDADLQHPPKALNLFLKELREGYDIVIGSRYVEGGVIIGWNGFRRAISRMAILLVHLAFPTTRCIADPVSGFFAVKKELIDRCDFELIGYKLLLEVIVKCWRAKVREVPISFAPRMKGSSKLSFKEIVNYISLIARLAFFRAVPVIPDLNRSPPNS